ncbi:MAG: hypothetical protein C0504_14820 [Candidatus Solibacter sp.]|nr:hypothetical protein [Candidatus Solibacter sp.]
MVFLAAGVVGSAFCLFLIQPMMAKRLLPVFGGSASVWAVCLVFYQSMLLLGYLYAHGLARRLPPRVQAAVHAGLCVLALLALPRAGAPPMEAGAGSPAAGIVVQLALAIGLPYLMLSATSPLLQHWYAQLYPAGQAYRLFAWSNLSCVAALLAFPFWLEPRWEWGEIARLWKWGFVAAALFHLLSAGLVWKRRPAGIKPVSEGSDGPPVLRRSVALWLYWAFLGSGLLVSVTDHLCLVVAPFPMLWVLPLLLYLLSFVVTFESDRYRRWWGVPAGFAGLLSMAWALTYLAPARMLGPGVAIFTLGLFAVCLMVHGELAASRPPERHLTSFYIAMAAGGAMGSVFVALIAPLVFRQMVEMPLLLAMTAVTALFLVYGRSVYSDALAAVAAVVIVAAAGANWLALQSRVVAVDRNFYGSMRVTESPGPDGSGRLRTMVHGAVNHGSQFVDKQRRHIPLTYYTAQTGAGQLLSRQSAGPRKVGLVGLGAGALASYGRPGDVFFFYEINPLVVSLARTHFSYLSDSPARVEMVLGDARIMLSRQPDQHFDVLAVDAFTGDSVPVHLLTREAMAIYSRHLKPDGVLALHLSNLHLDLTKVALAHGRELNWRSSVIATPADSRFDSVGAVWVLMSRGQAGPGLPSGPGTGPVWTDEHSSLLHVLR